MDYGTSSFTLSPATGERVNIARTPARPPKIIRSYALIIRVPESGSASVTVTQYAQRGKVSLIGHGG